MKRGFTLIELVVVLVILALLTHLAVRQLGAIQGEKRHELADRQLEQIRTAVWEVSATHAASGFLADLGRLPCAVAQTNEQGQMVGTLSELWDCPRNVQLSALRQAVPSNLVGTAVADEGVWVTCGWRGPYLRVPSGQTRLLDPWGNPLESIDDAGYSRLLTATGTAATEGDAVWRVRHLGADGQADARVSPTAAFDRDGEVGLLEGSLKNRLVVQAVLNESSAVDLSCRWYRACGSSITGGVATASSRTAQSQTFIFEGMHPGVYTITLYAGASPLALEQFVVPPHDTLHQIRLSAP